MDMTESLRERMSARKDAPAWVARAGMVAALAGVLTACGGQPAAEPTAAPAATTAPAEEATAPAEETAEPAAEATAAGEEAASPAAMASPVAAGMATPIAAGMATPVAAGMATPVAGAATPVAGMATPVGDASAYTPQICDSVNGWLARPEVAPVLQQPVWYQILEEGRKDAAGEPVDVALMQADFATLDGAATAMRGVASDDVKHGPVAIATQMIGRSARLAGGLADGTETQAQAQAAVTELQGLISAYEADSAARLAACGA